MRRALIFLFLGGLGGCTTLGPMAATTGVSAVPLSRPGAQIQLAATPGYYLSAATTEEHKGTPIPSLSALFEPGRLISVPGLYLAARLMGTDGSGAILQPMLGYRRTLDRMSLGVAFFGTQGSHENGEASYRAIHVGGEAHGDVRITAPGNFELHAVLGFMATYLSAEGDYCVDPMGFGRDCSAGEPTISAEADGLFPSAHVGLALDVGSKLQSVFHGARLTLVGAFGTMPTVVNGAQESSSAYVTVGLSLTVGLGAAD